MATSKPRSRSTPGFHKSSDISVQKNRRRTSTVRRRLEKKSSLSATVSSSGSEANAKSEDSTKTNGIYKPISSSGSSGLDANNDKIVKRKSKTKVVSKNRNAKMQSEKEKNPDICHSIEMESRGNETIHLNENVENVVNETLRWSNVCSDSEEEDERLRIYKENRRRRYVEAMHVKVAQRMSEFNQK